MNRTGLEPPRVSRVLVERYVAKLRKRRRWRRLSITVTVFLLLLGTVGYVVGWHTKVFDVRATKVSGVKVLTKQQILDAAKVPAHQPVAAVDTKAVKARILQLPRVRSVVVERSLPHSVVITVVERVPAAALPDAVGGFTIVDADGVAFDTAADVQALPPHVPVISLAQSPDAAPSADRDRVRQQVVTGALAALRALPEPIRARVTAISATGPYGITMDLTPAAAKQAKVTVDWGGGDQPDLKARILTILMARASADTSAHAPTHFDVSAPEAPAYS
jgi:cell division protein FtsQ